MPDEPIQVECYAGSMGEEIPRTVVQGGRRFAVVEVLERWLEESRDPTKGRRRWFRVQFNDGKRATIYRDLTLQMWFLRGRREAAPMSGDAAAS